MFCRVSAMPLGPSGFSRIAFQAYAVSFASPGRTHREVRDRPQRGHVLDRLVGGAVLAEADRVVRPHVDDRRLHHRGQAHGTAHVVAEGEERAAVGAGGPVQRDAVEDRAHRVLADAEVQRAAVGLGVPHLGGDRLRAERVRALHRGVVALREVRRAAPQLGQHVGQRLEHLAGRLAGGDALLVGLPRRQRLLPAHRAGRGRACGRAAPCARVRARPRTSYSAVHSACAFAPRSTTLRACASTSSATSKVLSGSKPRISLTAATSSSPSAEPCALPVFMALGAGKAMTVRSRMNDGPVGLGLGVLQRLQDAGDVLAALDDLDVPAVGLVALARCPRSARSSVSSSMEILLSS